ncbi:penicillin-binding protein 2, partial [Candidatus Aerophobetes bacterium]
MSINYRFIEKTNLKYERRIKVLLGVILFIFLVILIRVGWLQIVEGEKFLRLSQTAHLRLIPLANPRGLIVDRNERVIADNTASFSIGVIPESLENPEKTLLKLKSIFPDIDLRKAELKVKKVKNPFRPVVLKEGIDISKVTYIEERGEEFPSVVILSQPVRSYPYGKLLSHIVGYLGEVNKNELKNLSFLGVEAGDLVGKMGIEEVYNSYLQGEKGGRQVEVDVYGRVLKTIFQKDPLPGDTVYLTIDVNIQKIAREEMGDRKGVVIIANPY